MKNPLIVLTGPTAVGKTKLSLMLAHAVGGEILSADSMQVYRGLDIDSAKILPDEQEGIRHHLIDVLEPKETFDVSRFQQMAFAAMQEIRSRGHIPVITGGTGFYIQAVTRDIDFSESGGESIQRSEWQELAEKKGPGALYELLKQKDPEAATAIHPHNIKRVIRALEFYHQTGTPISAHNKIQHQKESPYNLAYFVLTDARSVLYDQIDRRVDDMLQRGLEREVRQLYDLGLSEDMTSMKAIGYKEFFPYFRGEYSLEEAVRLIKQNTRHYAKRQLTWFRREPDAIWLDKREFGHENDKILEKILKILREKRLLTA